MIKASAIALIAASAANAQVLNGGIVNSGVINRGVVSTGVIGGQTLLGGGVYGTTGLGLGLGAGLGGAYGTTQYVQPAVGAYTPAFRDISPNTVTTYVHELYEHGKSMLNRVKQQLGGRLDGPAVTPIPITIPSGYTPADMEELYGDLFIMSRCLNRNYFGRMQAVHPPIAQDQYRMPTPYSVDNCLYEAGQLWIEDSLEPYVIAEGQAMLEFIKTTPGAPLVRVPSFANFWRTHTPIEERVLIDTVIGTYNLGEAIINEVFRSSYPGPGFPLTPDFNALLSSPSALLDFGFAPGFAPSSNMDVENVYLNLAFRTQFCRSQIASLTGRRPVMAADPFLNQDGSWNSDYQPAWEDGYYNGAAPFNNGYGGMWGNNGGYGGFNGGYGGRFGGQWGPGPWGPGPWNNNEDAEAWNPANFGPQVGQFNNFVGQEDCMTHTVNDWYTDEFEGFAQDLLKTAVPYVRPTAVADAVVVDAAIAAPIVAEGDLSGFTWDEATGTFVVNEAPAMQLGGMQLGGVLNRGVMGLGSMGLRGGVLPTRGVIGGTRMMSGIPRGLTLSTPVTIGAADAGTEGGM
jgi:hypothetical protein